MILVVREGNAAVDNCSATAGVQLHHFGAILEVGADSYCRTFFGTESDDIAVGSLAANAGVRVNDLLSATDEYRVVATDGS